MVGSLITSLTMVPLESEAKLYSCYENGTVVIASQPCDQKRSRQEKKNSARKTCFLEDPKTHDRAQQRSRQ